MITRWPWPVTPAPAGLKRKLSARWQSRCVILWQISGKQPNEPEGGDRLCWWAWQVLNLRPLPCESESGTLLAWMDDSACLLAYCDGRP
jgi:hypothetical protein